jgi:hypothetical protein
MRDNVRLGSTAFSPVAFALAVCFSLIDTLSLPPLRLHLLVLVILLVREIFVVAHQAGLAPRLIPIPLAVWHALAWASEMLPSPRLTRNQVELMQIDTVSSPELPGFSELEISPHPVEAILQKMLSNSR